MESPKNTHISLVNLGQLFKDKVKLTAELNEQISDIKDAIREILQENDIKHFEDKEADIDIKVTYPMSFDFGLFKMDYPILTKRYFTTETITTVRDVYDKKQIKKECPEEYGKCEVELTPRLTVK